MKHLKRFLNTPIRNTIVFTVIVFVAYVLFGMLNLYMNRVEAATYPSTGSLVFNLTSMIINDFAFMSRLLLEVSIIALIVQGVYKLTQK